MEVEELRDELVPRLRRIEDKQEKQNGRVGRIELAQARFDGMRQASTGAAHLAIAAVATLTGLGALAISVFVVVVR